MVLNVTPWSEIEYGKKFKTKQNCRKLSDKSKSLADVVFIALLYVLGHSEHTLAIRYTHQDSARTTLGPIYESGGIG